MICVVGGVEASQAHYYSYRNVCIHNNKRPNDIDDDNRPYVVRHSTQYWRERSKKNYTRTHRHTYTCTQSTCAVCPEKIVFSLHSCDYGIQTLLLWCCWCWQSWLTTTTANSNFDDDVAKFSVHTHSRVVWIPYGHNTLLFTFYIILVGLFFSSSSSSSIVPLSHSYSRPYSAILFRICVHTWFWFIFFSSFVPVSCRLCWHFDVKPMAFLWFSGFCGFFFIVFILEHSANSLTFVSSSLSLVIVFVAVVFAQFYTQY